MDICKLTFDELYDYLEENRDNLSQDDIFKIEIRMEEIMKERRRTEIESKIWSKSLENKFTALYKSICKEYDIDNSYGKDFRDELEAAIREASECHYMYECSLGS